jgi:hypothetical protein
MRPGGGSHFGTLPRRHEEVVGGGQTELGWCQLGV